MAKKLQRDKPPGNGTGRISVLVSLHPDVLKFIDKVKAAKKIHRGVVIDQKFQPDIAAEAQ